MEALRLTLAATPQVAWNLNAQRGLPVTITVNPTRAQFESSWTSLFYNFDAELKISLSARDSDSRFASCEIYFDRSAPILPELPAQTGAAQLLEPIFPLAFERLSFAGDPSRLEATITKDQNRQIQFIGPVSFSAPPYWQSYMQQGPELGIACELFHSNNQYSSPQAAHAFSPLSIENRTSDLVDIIRGQFDEIVNIQTESPAGMAALYASLKYQKSKVPLALLSAGITKIVAILVAIKQFRRGVVLIDEIENGIWYKALGPLWAAIHAFAVEHETQVFLTTHSLECARAAADVVRKHENDFALLRVYQHDGHANVSVTPGHGIVKVIDAGLEFRV
jgi:hypothetical protein